MCGRDVILGLRVDGTTYAQSQDSLHVQIRTCPIYFYPDHVWILGLRVDGTTYAQSQDSLHVYKLTCPQSGS
jgi:hypothetical protein